MGFSYVAVVVRVRRRRKNFTFAISFADEFLVQTRTRQMRLMSKIEAEFKKFAF